MSPGLLLLRFVADCFFRTSGPREARDQGMHCLGASTGGQGSPGNRGTVLNVVRALGVLVCEGRIQGGPRGYKEGPHCVPPLQSAPNNHVCDKDKYLQCCRYLVLVREITERVASGSFLCVEVVLCSDCPCGLIKSKSKHRVSVPPIPSWHQHTSEMLLEYWCVGIVPSKSPETMNSQGLYQAVRSRLHFSQVAAWWSRTNGATPSYVATRIVEHVPGEDHLRRFRETPVEHTFPLAGLGDGNSVKVTMWALPRMEDIPCLQCPMHPAAQPNECPGETALDGCARATTPTNGAPLTGPVPTSLALLDDRLQIDCDKPGKHHCRCAEDEEDELEAAVAAQPPVVPPSRPNGERKRRRSLPCRPPEPSAPEPDPSSSPPGLPALEEAVPSGPGPTTDLDGLERSFRTQLSIDEQRECSPGNHEKRYKRSAEPTTPPQAPEPQAPQQPQQQQLLVGPWLSYSADGTTQNSGHILVNPLCAEEHPRKVTTPAAHLNQLMSKLSFSQEREGGGKTEQAGIFDWIARVPSRVLGSGDGGNGATITTTTSTTTSTTSSTVATAATSAAKPPKSELKLRNNCNLELSPREIDEVLAVLRARTPLSRRRAALRTAKRREKYDRLINEGQSPKAPEGAASTKADVLLGAILRSTSKENTARKIATAEDSTSNGKPVEERRESDAGSAESSSPTSLNNLNKRLTRLKQLLKRAQDKLAAPEEGEGPREATAKRRIDFSEEREEGEAEIRDEGEAHCDSNAGTSKKSARDTSTGQGASGAEPNEEEEVRCEMKRKERGRRDLSPIWVNHNNNYVIGLKAGEGCAKSELELGAEACDRTVVPSAKDQERFRRSLENAASMVFHSRTGLPLTSSPAPLRRGSCCFDFDSSLNSVSSKRSALFELNTPPSPGAVSLEENDRETENACDIEEVTRRRSNSRNRPQSHALLGSFEESALNGRLEPVSTVHGFTAEIGASGSFCPKHRKLPVTVFFYTLGDNDKVSSPYLAHINLGKKGYQVPRMGTIQVTLSNPLGTVVKMFVVLYDLSDMPARSHTFLRQRTLRDKTLRYLIHLRFMSGKSGRIYLHTDVRMIICRKSDVDTASDFGSEPPKELRSYIHGPTNPKFSPRC